MRTGETRRWKGRGNAVVEVIHTARRRFVFRFPPSRCAHRGGVSVLHTVAMASWMCGRSMRDMDWVWLRP